jgi:hypothetical protein
MALITIDTQTGEVKTARQIVVEPATGADTGGVAPARSIQVNGLLVSQTNPFPVVLSDPWLLFSRIGTNTTAIVKATPGVVFAFSIFSKATVTRYFQLFDKATAPTGADVPLLVFPVFADGGEGFLFLGNNFLGTRGLAFSAGIQWGWSSTEATYTAAVATEHTTFIRYL